MIHLRVAEHSATLMMEKEIVDDGMILTYNIMKANTSLKTEGITTDGSSKVRMRVLIIVT